MSGLHKTVKIKNRNRSRLSKEEKNYSTVKKECLEIYWIINKYKMYLEG